MLAFDVWADAIDSTCSVCLREFDAPLEVLDITDYGHADRPCDDCRRETEKANTARRITGLYIAARTALRRARQYLKEEGRVGQRQLDCLAAVQDYRAKIRKLRVS